MNHTLAANLLFALIDRATERMFSRAVADEYRTLTYLIADLYAHTHPHATLGDVQALITELMYDLEEELDELRA